MKTDRELLDLAAKAAGLYWRQDIADYRNEKGILGLWIKEPMQTLWNPLTDDGDALRLAVELDLVVEPGKAWLHKNAPVFGTMFGEDMLQCPMLATRRAIVRAAAAIGESMP